MEHEEENYYKPVRVNSFGGVNCIEYESSGDRNRALSAEEYLNKISPYLKGIINNLKKSDTWKIPLTIANNFTSSRYDDEERAIHLKSNNIEILINDETEEVIEEPFDSLKNRQKII